MTDPDDIENPARPPRFLVTAGNTRERIDRVRDWGNVFTGNTGCGSPARWPTSATSTC